MKMKMKNKLIIKYFGYKQWRIIHDHELIVIVIYHKKRLYINLSEKKWNRDKREKETQ